MAYEYITKYNFPAYTANKWVAEVFGQGERAIGGDCIHWWGLPEWRQTLHGVCAFFMGQPPAGTSAHYVLTAGVVACGINEADASHANGNSWANAHLVTWECDPNATDGVYATLADAMSDTWIARGYKKPGRIYGHSDFVATQCPGDFDLDRIRREVTAAFNAKLRGSPAVAPQADNVQELEWSEMASKEEVEDAGYRGAKRAIRELLGDVVEVPSNQGSEESRKNNPRWTVSNALTNIWHAANAAAQNNTPERVAEAVLRYPVKLEGSTVGTTDLYTKIAWLAHEQHRNTEAVEALTAQLEAQAPEVTTRTDGTPAQYTPPEVP